MKTYFERLQQLATTAVAELRVAGRRDLEMHRSYLEDRQRGNLTEQGYKSLVQALDMSRNKAVSDIKAKIAALESEFNAATDELTAPDSAAMHSADLELMKHLELSVYEFDRLAEKHKENPTMLRLLDSYRKEHSIDTAWRYQTAAQRKEIFSNLCFSVESIVAGQASVSAVNPNAEDLVDGRTREERIRIVVSKAYHKMQGSDPEAFPLPEDAVYSAYESMKNTGRVLI